MRASSVSWFLSEQGSGSGAWASAKGEETSPRCTRPHLCAGLGGRTGAQAGGSCHSRTHAGGMQTAGLPCGHVSAPPTEVGAQVPSLWALGARQAADERRCRLTLS